MVTLNKTTNGFKIRGRQYILNYDRKNKYHIDLNFNNGIGAQLYISSSCDQEKEIDRCIDITGYSVKKRVTAG